MNTKIEIYVGSPIEIVSEKVFLYNLCKDLDSRGLSGIIFANFFVPPDKALYQVDFLVILEDAVTHVELKNLSARVHGKANGNWELLLPDGTKKRVGDKNPFKQALDCKMAISDEMHKFQASSKGKYYKAIESCVCVYPRLIEGSTVPSNFKVKTVGYPEFLDLIVSSKKRPNWSLDDWRRLAMYLQLSRVESERSSEETELAQKQELVRDYQQRFRDFHVSRTTSLAPIKLIQNDAEVRSDSILNLFELSDHVQFVGESGVGKSHHVVHIALNSVDQNYVPIIANAIDYDGKLTRLLDRGIAHLCNHSAMNFIGIAQSISVPITLVVDGFNECPAGLQQKLIKDILAFHVRTKIAVVFTSQEAINLPPQLSGQEIRFCELDSDQKQAILRSAGGQDSNADEFVKPFQTAFEVSLAADCLSEIGDNKTKAGLIDSYLRLKSRLAAVDYSVAKELYCAIAEAMHRDFRQNLTVSQVWEVGHRVLSNNGIPMVLLQKYFDCGLLRIEQGRCKFRHELFQRFFEYQALVSNSKCFESLVSAILMPRNSALLEFTIESQASERNVRLILSEACKTGIPGDLIDRCRQSKLGTVCKSVVDKDISKTLREAKTEIDDIEFRFDFGEGKSGGTPSGIAIGKARCRTSYENCLLSSLARGSSNGENLDELLNIVGATSRRCFSQLKSRYKIGEARESGVKSFVLQHLAVFGIRGKDMPASTIMCSLNSPFVYGCTLKVKAIAAQRFQQPELLDPSEIYLLLKILDHDAREFGESVPGLLKHCWETGIYHLNLELLEKLGAWCFNHEETGLCDKIVEEIKDILQGFETDNVFLSTQLVETLFSLGVIESPATASRVVDEIAGIIAQPKNELHQQMAYGAVTNIFEEIFSDAYVEAIESLNPEDQTKLHVMAALGSPDHLHMVNFILRRLVEYGSVEAMPAFRKFTSFIALDAMCQQDAIACFMFAHIGSARHIDKPLQLSDLSKDGLIAWQLYGELLFWTSKLENDKPARDSKLQTIWAIIIEEYPFVCVGPLRGLLTSSGLSYRTENGTPLHQLVLSSRCEIRNLLEFGLRNRDRLTGISKFRQEHETKTNTFFMIDSLGQLGSSETIAILAPFVDDPVFGDAAVKAIGQINSGKEFEHLMVTHRF